MALMTNPATESTGTDEIEASMTFSLSDLIREGASTEQCFGDWYGPNGERCALAAAYEAAKVRHLV